MVEKNDANRDWKIYGAAATTERIRVRRTKEEPRGEDVFTWV